MMTFNLLTTSSGTFPHESRTGFLHSRLFGKCFSQRVGIIYLFIDRSYLFWSYLFLFLRKSRLREEGSAVVDIVVSAVGHRCNTVLHLLQFLRGCLWEPKILIQPHIYQTPSHIAIIRVHMIIFAEFKLEQVSSTMLWSVGSNGYLQNYFLLKILTEPLTDLSVSVLIYAEHCIYINRCF